MYTVYKHSVHEVITLHLYRRSIGFCMNSRIASHIYIHMTVTVYLLHALYKGDPLFGWYKLYKSHKTNEGE